MDRIDIGLGFQQVHLGRVIAPVELHGIPIAAPDDIFEVMAVTGVKADQIHPSPVIGPDDGPLALQGFIGGIEVRRVESGTVRADKNNPLVAVAGEVSNGVDQAAFEIAAALKMSDVPVCLKGFGNRIVDEKVEVGLFSQIRGNGGNPE